MSSSNNNIKGLEKMKNIDRDRNTSEKIINKLNEKNNNGKIYENKNSYLFPNNTSDKEKDNMNPGKININNHINELIEENIITLKNQNQKEKYLDVNNILDVDYEKMLKKIIELNRSLNSIQTEKIRLNSEKDIFLNRLKEINQKSNDEEKNLISFPDIKYKKDENNSNRKQNLISDNDKKRLLNKYEDDINYLNDLLVDFNDELDILK